MKKLILGCTLILVGVIGFCSEYLKQAIYVASPNNIITTGTDYEYGIILIVIGVVLSLWGILKKGDSDE